MAKKKKEKALEKVKIPTEDFQPHSWHLDVLKSFDNGTARFLMLNWHRRARKTTLAMNILIREAVKNPNRVFIYIAPTYTQAKAIIWTDPNMLFRYLPKQFITKRNESELYVQLFNGSLIRIFGADNPDSIRGVDCMGAVIDEFALMKNALIYEEILRPIIAQSKDRWCLFTFTPKGRNHAWEYWRNADKWEDWYKSYLPVDKSQLIPEEELVKARREMPPTLYQQEMECSFLADEDNVLITSRNLEELKDVQWKPLGLRKIIACDPSEGGDECVIYINDSGEIIEEKILTGKLDPMKIAGELVITANKHKIYNFAIDSIGIGSGILHRLQEICPKGQILSINSAERATNVTRFYNRRAEMWWNAMEMIRDGEVPYIEDTELKRQLSSVNYMVVDSNGKIKLEPKKKTKERLRRSPDRADCYVYMLWGLKQLKDTKNYGFVRKNIDKIKKMALVCGASGW